MCPPVPSTNPFRRPSNGRLASSPPPAGDSTRIRSWTVKKRSSKSSMPPHTKAVARPCRRPAIAKAMAAIADACFCPIVTLGPRRPNSIEQRLAAALAIVFAKPIAGTAAGPPVASFCRCCTVLWTPLVAVPSTMPTSSVFVGRPASSIARRVETRPRRPPSSTRRSFIGS